MAELSPGSQSSEYKLASRASWIAAALIAVGAVDSVLAQVMPLFPEAKWIGAALTICGVVLKLGSLLGYTAQRTELKGKAMDLAATQAANAAFPIASPPHT